MENTAVLTTENRSELKEQQTACCGSTQDREFSRAETIRLNELLADGAGCWTEYD